MNRIELTNVSKTFKVFSDEKHTARELFAGLFSQGKAKEFKALEDISLTIGDGEFVGIIGRNGSGKSTLLKIIANIYAADKGGEVITNGKIIPFLELGVGFNQDLSGRENIFLNGTILGMSKEYLREKFDDIVEFAELEKFIEEPVKTYSSGMLVRLAFAIAIQSDADIYILDEILAVGDERFQRKSASIINRLKKEGKTILFVSHSMDTIEHYCNRAILIHDSQVQFDGKPTEAIDLYRKLNNKDNIPTIEHDVMANRLGDRSVEITDVKIVNESGEEVLVVNDETKSLTIEMKYKNHSDHEKLLFGVSWFRDDDTYITGTNTKNDNVEFIAKESGVVRYSIDPSFLLDGNYMITVAVFEYETVHHLDFHSKMYPLEVRRYAKELGAVAIPAEWEVK